MPLYEFRCEECQARFERLVEVGAEQIECAECGSPAGRILSAPAPSPRLVMTGSQDRQMQIKRGVDRASAKERFSERRQKQRDAKGRGGGGS